MRLNDLDKQNYASKALKENFELTFDVSAMDKSKTKTMLNKVNGLIKESRSASDFYRNQNSPAYLKLVFMEQALSSHYAQLQARPSPRIVFENEEVEKSQVILAAQDMVDSVQKYYEDVNDMLVKELPALVDSIQSEIGVNESATFNQQAGDALTALNAALLEAKTALQGALGGLTGQAGADAFAAPEMPIGGEEQVDVDADVDVDAEMPTDMGIPVDDDEDEANLAVGRAKR